MFVIKISLVNIANRLRWWCVWKIHTVIHGMFTNTDASSSLSSMFASWASWHGWWLTPQVISWKKPRVQHWQLESWKNNAKKSLAVSNVPLIGGIGDIYIYIILCNNPIGSIYHLYTTYSPCQFGWLYATDPTFLWEPGFTPLMEPRKSHPWVPQCREGLVEMIVLC